MLVLRVMVAATVLFFLTTIKPHTAAATVIHESAILGATGITSGFDLSSKQFLGSRFSITRPASVTRIGGHIFQTKPGGLFGAIIALPSDTSLPNFSPQNIEANVLASTTFNAAFPSTDIVVPLSVFLTPGDYALVFGTNAFGATGSGAMPFNNTDLPGASYFRSDEVGGVRVWRDSVEGNQRFVVEIVPVPAALPLFCSAMAVIGLIGWSEVSRNSRQAYSDV